MECFLCESPRLHPVRFLLPIAMFGLLAATGFGQQVQERKLLDRLTRPDTSLEFDLRNSSFGGKEKAVSGKQARSQEYRGTRDFAAKDFQARSFQGQKEARAAQREYAAKSARTDGRYEIPGLGKKPVLRAVPVENATEASKAKPTQEYADAHRGAKGGDPGKQGRSQDRLTAEQQTGPTGTTPVGWSGNMKQMTIDDIRELLNKNK